MFKQRQLPSNTYAFVEKYSPMGKIIIKAVKNRRVLKVEAKEPSFLQNTSQIKAFCLFSK